jgi:hypothetical protein
VSALSEPALPPRLHLVPNDQTVSDEEARDGDGPERPGEASGGEQHARIPDTILYCTALPVGARLLYGALQRHKGSAGCFPSVRTLAAELGVSTRSIDSWLDALVAAGAVVVDQPGGGRRSTRYDLTGKVRSVVPSTTKASRSVVLAAPQGGKICGAGGQQVQQSHSHVTRALEPEPSAPTERDAPSEPAESAPASKATAPDKSMPSKPKRSATRKAGADGGEQEPGARAAPRPDGSQAGYELMVWWCERTNNRLIGDERRRVALGADDLLRKTNGDADEAHAYLDFRIGRGRCDLRYVARDYLPTWRASDGKAGRVGGAGGNARAHRSTAVSDWDNFDYEGWERQERERRGTTGDQTSPAG